MAIGLAVTIHHLVGSATEPIKDKAIIAHCCNDIGGWGSGFVLALNRDLGDKPKDYYKLHMKYGGKLGDVNWVDMHDGLKVANIIGQRGVRSANNPAPIDYNALFLGIRQIRLWMDDNHGWSLHMPRLGAGLAGGDWDLIESMLKETLYGHPAYVYTLPNEVERWLG